MGLSIRPATAADLDFLASHDRHIARQELRYAVERGRILLAEWEGKPCGWLRYNLFWDNTPFMNLLYLLEPYRGKGVGRALTLHWEAAMAAQGYPTVMLSTAADEYAQHFYTKLGYAAAGGFTLPGDPYELIFTKVLTAPQND